MIDVSRDAFRQSATSPIYVPEPLSRVREVWTDAEYRLMQRMTALLNARGVAVFFGCTDARCRHEPVQRLVNADGGITLRCAHKDRVFVKGL